MRQRCSPPVGGPPSAPSPPAPTATGLASACQEALSWLALLALVAYLVRYLERWPGAAVVGGLAAAAGLVPGTVHTAGEFLLYYAIRLIYLAAAVLLVKHIVRRNYLRSE